MPSPRVTPFTTSAILMAWASLSITQGPAMRNSSPPPTVTGPIWNGAGGNLPSRYFFWAMEHFNGARLSRQPPLQPVRIRRTDEFLEQRMRLQRLRLELGMELASDEVRVIGQLNHFDVGSVRGRPRDPQSRRYQGLLILAVEFVA